MRSVVDRNVFMWRIPVHKQTVQKKCWDVNVVRGGTHSNDPPPLLLAISMTYPTAQCQSDTRS